MPGACSDLPSAGPRCYSLAMQNPEALAAVAEELDTLGDIVIEQDAKTTEILACVKEMRSMLVQALTEAQEIPVLRRRIVAVEMRLDAAE